nr:hypothetical protein [Deltaproteobacteria bacterium]
MLRWLLVLVLLGAPVSEAMADSIALTVPARKPGAPNVPALETFVFQHDPYRSGIPPRRLDPAHVGAYLAVMIDKATPQRALESAETAAVFYDASEVAAPFVAMLDGKETTVDDRRRSIVLARIVASVGGSKDVSSAASYFVDLCGRADSQAELQDLV